MKSNRIPTWAIIVMWALFNGLIAIWVASIFNGCAAQKIKITEKENSVEISHDGYSADFWSNSTTGFRPFVVVRSDVISFHSMLAVRAQTHIGFGILGLDKWRIPATLVMSEDGPDGHFEYYRLDLTKEQFTFLSQHTGLKIEYGPGYRSMFDQDDQKAFKTVLDFDK